ncbi:MYXO-CTERM sorting domain-containing protein [Chondromyces crocatus]|uniref:Uncharacterized protein n=1 Tax=Chondromyces crocatus TaxID=52 RepID=A0A0K1EBE9_CHOCO|nr:MYXO-CTERM sorting domain-containing protein [Chondromyces crocatus]AKT38185.1 uncharacterized protein CMC5_023280 [Chondromyces crocatus]
MRTVRLSFRPEGSDFTGGGDAYRSRVSPDGVTITPVRHPRQKLPRPDAHAANAPSDAPPQLGAPLTLATTHLARGDRAFQAPSAPRIERDGHLAILHGPDATEHLHNTDEGLSLSYTFANPPEGHGDLTVRLRVGGQRYAGQTPLGHHYRDAATGLGIRVGLATWIDARGTTTPVTVHALPEAGALELHVPADVLAASAYPAVLDPILSPESGLDQPLLGQASGGQRDPAIAGAGDGYLVAWTDTRLALESIFAARVAADGTVLDPYGIHLGPGARPAVAYDGANYLVVQQAATTQTLRGTRISPVNGILDPGGFPIAPATSTTRNPAATFDGTHFVVAWLDAGTRLARVDTAGTVLDPGGLLLDPGLPAYNDGNARAALASDGTNTLVVWQASDRRIHGVRVDPGGVALDVPPLHLGPATPGAIGQRNPAITFDGANYVIAWLDSPSEFSSHRIEATRVTPQGTVLDPAGLLVATEPSIYHYLGNPRAAFDGQNTVVTWTRTEAENPAEQVHRARITPTGTVLDPGGALLSTHANESALAGNGNGTFVVWTDLTTYDRVAGPTLRATRLAPDGTILDTPSRLLATSANGQTQPTLAFDGVNYLVAWTDDRAYDASRRGTDLFATRVTPQGTVLDPSGIAITTDLGFQFAPRAVFDGVNTLVAWWSFPRSLSAHGDHVYTPQYARVSPAGQLLDPIPVSLPLESYDDDHLGVASNGQGTLLAVDSPAGVQGVLVAHDGTHGPVLTFAEYPDNWLGLRPDLTSDGDGYLVVWRFDSRNGPLHGARITAQGQTLDVGGFPITPPGVVAHTTSLGFDGTNYLVVWEQLDIGGGTVFDGDGSVHAARVSPLGDVLDPQGIVITPASNLRADTTALWTNPGSGTLPATTCRAGHCLIAWRHRTTPTDPYAIDLHAAVLSAAGTVSPSFVLSAEPGIEGPPALCAGPVEALVAYSRFDHAPPHGTERVLTRRLGWIPCTTSATCPTGATCEDDVCVTTLATGEGGSAGHGGSGAGGAGQGGAGQGATSGAGGSGAGGSGAGGAGQGGTAGEGGTSGHGGNAGQGGAGEGGTAGEGPGSGTSTSTSTGGNGEAPGDDGSCGCTVPGTSTRSTSTAASSLAALALLAARRRSPLAARR